MSARSRVVFSAWLVFVAGCGGAPDELQSFSADELSLQDREQPELRKTLQAGTWLIEVRERDIDVRTHIESPKQKFELLDSTPRHGVVFQVVTLTAPGEILVRLSSADHPSWRGSADVRIARFARSASDAPGHVEQGYIAWSTAAAQQALASPEAWTVAADKLNEAIASFDAAGDDAARARAAYSLATLQYADRDDWSAAIRATGIAAEAFDEAGDEAGMQNAAVVRAAVEIELAAGMNAGTQRAEQKALYESAERSLATATQFFEEHAMPLRAAYALNMRGIRALNLGADEDAAKHFSRSLEIARSNRDTSGQVKALANLAWVHRLQGFVAKAAEEYATLLPLVDPQRQTHLYAVVLNNYGFCLIAVGDFDRALRLHTEALELFTRLGDQEEHATQLAALGTLHFRIGDTTRALETLRAAIDAQERAGDTRGLASTLRLAGNTASLVGHHDLALEYLRRSASIDANPHDVSRTRVLIAGELRNIGDLRAAEAELRDPLASPNPVVSADAMAERARLRLSQNNLPAALADLRAADKSYADLGLEFSRIDTNASLSQLLLTTGDIAGAERAADEAVSIVQRLRVNSGNPEWRARFLSAQYAPFEARIAVEIARSSNEHGAWQGFRTADEVRARSLADQLARHSSPIPEDPEAARLRDVLTTQLLRLEARVQRQDPDEAGTLALRGEIAETRAQLDKYRVGRGAISAGTGQLPASLRAVQQSLPAGTVVLAYFVGDASSHGWLLARDRLRHVSFAGRAKLQRAIDATADHATGPASRQKAERELGNMLLGSLLEGTAEQRMLVIPDGPLNGVPFAALPLPDAPGNLLLDRFHIGYAPSLSLALSTARPHAPVRRVAVISDPVYAPDDKRLATAAVGGNLRGQRQASTNKLTRLPFSALEARAVAKTFGPRDTIELAGFDAVPERVLQLPSSELSVLHFATHAVARKDSPERSALFLSEYTPDGKLIADSQLTSADIMRSGLKAQLVVLSGCATGDGGTLRGEGVLGLTYGFLANGSGAVVASLWPVEDASTARFMTEFYRAYRASGNTADALREAQLRTRNSAGAAVWSSFVVRANGFP